MSLPAKLDIEHVMPQGWRTYWQDGILHDPEACATRDFAINTIGSIGDLWIVARILPHGSASRIQDTRTGLEIWR